MPNLDPDNLPKHIAIIMDGNGRWAKAQGLVRLFGHQVGVKIVKKIVRTARENNIKVLTLYAFSTENWQRPKDEVSGLMKLLRKYLEGELSDMLKNDIQLRCIGQIEKLPPEVRQVLTDTINKTANNQGLILNLALSYGGRAELLKAIKEISEDCCSGKINSTEITEKTIDQRLYTNGLPDPDLLIRTGGEARLSNFLLWQASYAEIIFTDTPWPEFSPEQFLATIETYQQRQRRFGKTSAQVENKTRSLAKNRDHNEKSKN